MKRQGHPSIVEARRELLRNGFWPLHTNNGYASYGEVQGLRRFAIQRAHRDGTTTFNIIEDREDA